MDIVSFLTSINKISLVAFLGTLFFLSYEVILIRKEREKKNKPTIPQFQENAKVAAPVQNVAIPTAKKKITKHSNTFIIILIVLLVLFGGGAAIGFLNLSSPSSNLSNVVPTPGVDLIPSRGVRILSPNFVPLSDQEVSRLKPGDTIIIGVETVEKADIDSARIRVNKLRWSQENITTSFDPKNKLYYMTYTIATAESQLKIEAQLHSRSDGWLGE